MQLMSNYQLSFGTALLHDYEEAISSDTVNALVASGDCFITLATQLDDIVHTADDDSANQEALEGVIRTLMYLQRHYAVVKKQPNYRQ